MLPSSQSPHPWEASDLAELALLGLVGYVSFAYYAVVGVVAGARGWDLGGALRTPVDGWVPYLPVFAFSYGLAYVLPLLAAVCVARTGGLAAFRRGFFAYLGLLVLHFAIWLAFPTSARGIMLPEAEVARGTFAAQVRFFYAIAPPWNAFPSFHVAGCWFFYRVLARWEPGPARWYQAWFWTMFVSTLALKLHWFLDAVGGLAVAEAYFRSVYRPLDERGAFAWTWESTRARFAALIVPLILLAAGLGLSLARLGFPIRLAAFE